MGNSGKPDSALRQRAQAAIDAYVLPYVRNHGGDMSIVDIDDDGVVTCRLDGACRGCPAAPVTVVAVIERALQAPALKAWKGQAGNVPAAQKALYHRSKLNSAATFGRYKPEMEKEALAA